MSLEEYFLSVWEDYASIDRETYRIKKHSIPIIYHGDYNKFQESILKIITAELNPNNNEFPEYNPSLRYRELNDYTQKKRLEKYDAAQLLDSLNSYYTRNSNKWYDHYEPILNGLNASYYGTMENTVLHTNILTPLSLTKNWSDYAKDSPDNLNYLIKHGHSQWLKLIDILQPDIIITSIGDKYRDNILNGQKINWIRIENITTNTNGKKRRKPYQVQCAVVCLDSGKKTLLVIGDKSALPFMISQKQKLQIGAKLFRLMSNIYHERKPKQFQALQETPVAETRTNF